MNNNINVEPSRLIETASKIDSSNDEYQRLFTTLYSEVDKLSGNWGGKDNVAFNDRIRSFKGDFKQISLAMKQYSDFLRASARAYQETQDELVSSASRLKG